MSKAKATDVVDDYVGADLGDARLNARLVSTAAMVSAQPDSSFPKSASDDAELEATYRFLSNKRVSPAAILAPHVRQTLRRASTCERVVIAHDTTEFNFGTSRRADLGYVAQGASFGFFGHFALAIDGSESRMPLGVAAHEMLRREVKKKTEKKEKTDPSNEFHRWARVIKEAQEQFESVRPIHVMDREADSYELMVDLAKSRTRFVIRLSQTMRATAKESASMAEVIERARTVARRDVPITARGRSPLPSRRKSFPPRDARLAHLEVSATTVTVARPHSSRADQPKTLTLNVVRVFEPNPPEQESPVEWRLWTNEPVNTEAEILAIVDAYRCRWRIEEFFKALKTGCAIEKRQLESYQGLINTVALMAPIAWRLLHLRTLAREQEQLPATHALTPSQLLCLGAVLRKRGRPPLPEVPTARDAMLGVAALGGHIKNNGEPGWIVLGRGLDDLLMIEVGYLLAKEQESRCDQS